MQAIFNFAQNNAERGCPHDDVGHRMAQFFELFGLRTATLRAASTFIRPDGKPFELRGDFQRTK